MLLTELLTPDRLVVPLAARDKQGTSPSWSAIWSSAVAATSAQVLASVEERESVLSTGIGLGVAIPHARCSAVQELGVVGGVAAEPVPYDSIDGDPVRLFSSSWGRRRRPVCTSRS